MAVLLAMGPSGRTARAQVVPPTIITGGVYVDPQGMVHYRETDPSAQLAQVRIRGKSAAAAAGEAKLCYISLPRLLDEVRQLTAAGKDIPDQLRYLGGMTQLRYVLVYPEEKDLVIAGPSEPWDATTSFQPVGKRTGRPVLHLDDLVVALRMAGRLGKGEAFGCSLDMRPGSFEKSAQVMQEYGRRPREEIFAAMAEALGPQQVNVFGVPPDTRLAFVCVAADYKLKRMSLGIDPSPVAGVGHGIDNTRQAGNRFWFEPTYEPMAVSPDGDAFELRGPRLVVKAGATSFDEGGTETGRTFARQFTQHLPQLAAALPVLADLQNVTDLAMLAALIRHDKLDQQVGWDTQWLTSGNAYRVTTIPVPRTADTLVCSRSGSIAAGGVNLSFAPWVADANRQQVAKDTLSAIKSPPNPATPSPDGSPAIRFTPLQSPGRAGASR